MPPKKSNTLTEAELRLMKILWRRGESAVNDLVAAMPDGETLAYNSVLTTIRILEQKGYVEHRQEGRAFVYRPCVAEEEASRSEVRHLMSRFFGNSREQLVLSLLGDDQISAKELERLKEAIRNCGSGRERGRSRCSDADAAFTPLLDRVSLGMLSGAAGSLESALRAISTQAAGAALTALWQGALLVCGSCSLPASCTPHFGGTSFCAVVRGFHHAGEFAGAGAGVELSVRCGWRCGCGRACGGDEPMAAAG